MDTLPPDNKYTVIVYTIHEVGNVARFLIICVCVFFIIKTIMEQLPALVVLSPDQLSVLPALIEKIGLGTITSWLCTLGAIGWGYQERKGKKRAIREKGKLQKELEKNDPGRTSSGLTPDGEPPED